MRRIPQLIIPPVPAINQGTMRDPWSFVSFMHQYTMRPEDLPFTDGRQFWVAPCTVTKITDRSLHNWRWRPEWLHEDAVVVDSMAKARMLKLVHRWENLLVLRTVLSPTGDYTFIWWCDQYPDVAHQITVNAGYFMHRTFSNVPGTARTLPMRLI